MSTVRTLRPLVFVPADGAGWNPAYPEALDAAVSTALRWWQDRLGLLPFQPAYTIAIGGLQPRPFYTAQPDTQERIRQELSAYYPELAGSYAPTASPDLARATCSAGQVHGVQPQTAPRDPQPANRNGCTVYLVYAVLGSDPYHCPGNVIGTSAAPSNTGNGPPLLIIQSSGSLDAFVSGQNPQDPLSGSRAAQTGALAHELGHALGLPHPTDPAAQALSVMWSWWTFPTCSLTPQEAQAAAFATNWTP